jgi:hypothetical protein
MNELQTLRNLRESTSSSDESLSALRHDLLREIRAPRGGFRRGFRVPRPAWRLAVTGALAVSLLGAATIVQRGAEPTSPVAFLEHAAAAVESQESGKPDRPRDDQWVYQKTHWDVPSSGDVWPSLFYAAGGEREEWIRFDGRGWWDVRDGKPREVPMKPDFVLGGNPAEVWDTWQTLPRDPQALLEETYDLKAWVAGDLYVPQEDVFSEPRNRDRVAVSAISSLLVMGRGLTAPKDVQATLYRTLGLIPDVEVIKDVKDAAGRDAIAVTFAPTSKVIILLDPVTYDYLGWGTELEDNKVTGGIALLEAKVVDKPGAR